MHCVVLCTTLRVATSSRLRVLKGYDHSLGHIEKNARLPILSQTKCDAADLDPATRPQVMKRNHRWSIISGGG